MRRHARSWPLLLGAAATLAGLACEQSRSASPDAEARDAGTRRPADGACVPPDAGAEPEPLDASLPSAPLCCTGPDCAAVGRWCNPSTCRCEEVPCSVLGTACDPALLPGLPDDLVCATAQGGRTVCEAHIAPRGICPPGSLGCLWSDASGCACDIGCRPFGDDCPRGVACRPATDVPSPAAIGAWICRGRIGPLPPGSACATHDECGAGALCAIVPPAYNSVCVAPDCGLAEGAPSCTSRHRCQPLDAFSQVGVCQLACNPYDERGPCAADEACLWNGAPGTSAGACVRSGGAALPRAGEPCTDVCASGATCVDGTCAELCDPRVRAPADIRACPVGQRCVVRWDLGICATSCDPWSADRASACPPRYYCAIGGEPCASASGSCLPRPQYLPGLDEPCWDTCDSGLVCSRGTLARCARACDPGAELGASAACTDGQHCFRVYAPGRVAVPLPYGFCDEPCSPGTGACPDGTWCEPHELDPVTGSWVGTCR